MLIVDVYDTLYLGTVECGMFLGVRRKRKENMMCNKYVCNYKSVQESLRSMSVCLDKGGNTSAQVWLFKVKKEQTK